MHTGTATITQIALDAERAARLQCAPTLIPAPGQVVLAHAADDPHAPLPVPLFPSALHADGFTAAGPLPPLWQPGTSLQLRGPLGHGFSLLPHARAVGLIALGHSPARLLPLIDLALKQGASVALCSVTIPNWLPPAVEMVGPASAPEIAAWADTLAIDLPRASLPNLAALTHNAPLPPDAQVLVSTPIPCGGMGECGVCAVNLRRGWALACKDGPVFPLKELLT